MAIPAPLTINPLVSARLDGDPKPWTGVLIIEDIDLLVSGVRNGSWIEGGLGAISYGLDVRSLAIDPVGTLLSYGIAWLIEHVKPLRDQLDALTGDPAAVAAHAQTWRNIAASLDRGACDLGFAQRTDTPTWTGAAQTAYHALSTDQITGIDGLARAAHAVAIITDAAGMLVGVVRGTVRDIIAVLLGQLIKWAALQVITAGGATAAAAVQVTNLIATCASRIAALVRALLTSLRNLRQISQRLDDLVNHLRELFRQAAGPALAFDGPPVHWAMSGIDDPPKPSGLAAAGPGAGPGLVPLDQIPPPLTGDRLPADATVHAYYRNEFERYARRRWSRRPIQNHAADKERYRLFVDAEGRLRVAGDNPRNSRGSVFPAGDLFDTTRAPISPSLGWRVAIWVMDGSGNLYATTKYRSGVFHHTSFLGGADVVGAGELQAVQGRLILWGDSCGHYDPSAAQNDLALAELIRQGVRPHPDFVKRDHVGRVRP